jgi:hypothetical protein
MFWGAIFIAIASFTAGGFVAGWMACAAFQAADDVSDQGA